MKDELKSVYYCRAHFTADDAYLRVPLVNQGAINEFKVKFEKYVWAIDGWGTIRNHGVEEEVKDISLAVDFDDPKTIASFNLLPQIFSHQLSPLLAEKFAISVFFVDDEFGDETVIYDAIVLVDGQLCLRDFYEAMRQTQEENLSLVREVAAIMRTLPDIRN